MGKVSGLGTPRRKGRPSFPASRTGSWQYPWRSPVWTYGDVRRVWPSATRLLARPFERLPLARIEHLLQRIRQYEVDGFECLRWARWGNEENTVQVTCLRCGKVAWSHTPTVKRRWRCVVQLLYKQQQHSKHWNVGYNSRHGCGLRFTDTDGTPFAGMQLPLGMVFLALYFSPARLKPLLIARGDAEGAAELAQVLQTLKQRKHARLLGRMRQFAKVFGGRILLEDYQDLVSARGQALVRDRLIVRAIKFQRVKLLKDKVVLNVVTQYKMLRTQLGILHLQDRAHVEGRGADRYRREIVYREFLQEVQRLADPIATGVRARRSSRREAAPEPPPSWAVKDRRKAA